MPTALCLQRIELRCLKIGNLKEKNAFQRRHFRKVWRRYCDLESRAPKLCTCQSPVHSKHTASYTDYYLLDLMQWWILEYLASEKFVLASESNLSLATGLASWKVSLKPWEGVESWVRSAWKQHYWLIKHWSTYEFYTIQKRCCKTHLREKIYQGNGILLVRTCQNNFSPK